MEHGERAGHVAKLVFAVRAGDLDIRVPVSEALGHVGNVGDLPGEGAPGDEADAGAHGQRRDGGDQGDRQKLLADRLVGLGRGGHGDHTGHRAGIIAHGDGAHRVVRPVDNDVAIKAWPGA